jgi:hypothetical protein
MKKLGKFTGYFFPQGNSAVPIALLGLAAAASSCSVVAVCLWAAHSPPAHSPVDATRRDCLEHSDTVCGGTATWQKPQPSIR